MSMQEISHVFSIKTSRNPQNRQISHYRYVWGQPRPVTSDDFWKFKMQCQRPDVVMCWPKSCIISPFLLLAASYVAENTISLKKIGWRPYLLWRYSYLTWPDPVNFFWLKLHKGCPISYVKLAIPENSCRGELHPPPPTARARFNVYVVLRVT